MSTFEIEEVGLPTNNDEEVWKKFWKSKNQPWRTEPEIDKERQEYLSERRKIKPDFEQGIYQFKDIKLSRADIEWLLATHENGRGPVNWNDESQRERRGLDLRGADLRKEQLQGLPLTRIIAGTSLLTLRAKSKWEGKNKWEGKDKRVEAAKIHLEGAFLINAHLEGADLSQVHLEGANLYNANLEGAFLYMAHLEGANLYNAHLEKAFLSTAFFDSATKLEKIVLSNNDYDTASLSDIH